MTAARRALGAAGEDAGGGVVRAHGYDVLAPELAVPRGELDLVVRRGRELVFGEVKTRRTDRFGIPAEAVTPTSSGGSARWPAATSTSTGDAAGTLRFDVVSILGGRLEVIEAAF